MNENYVYKPRRTDLVYQNEIEDVLKRMDPIEFFDGRKSAMKIIIVLYQRFVDSVERERDQYMIVDDVHQIVGGSKLTLTKRIQELSDEGLLISERDERIWPYERRLLITERGQRIASVLVSIRGL